MTNTTITNEQHNHLVDVFTRRMQQLGIKPTSKKFIELQTEFFMGAIALMDIGKEKSSVSPHIYISILRGDIIEKREI